MGCEIRTHSLLSTAMLLMEGQGKTSVNLREKVAFSPFLLIFSLFSTGIKFQLNAPGNDWNRDLNIPNVRI